METPREFADKIWDTKGMSENYLQEFTIPLNAAIDMIENYCKKKDEAINKLNVTDLIKLKSTQYENSQMRKIRFRAKIAGTDEWIFGLPFAVYIENDIDSIRNSVCEEYIKTDTLGQSTGLIDTYSNEIYEGDIVLVESFGSPLAEVRYVEKDGCWGLFHESFNRTVTQYKRLTQKNIKAYKIKIMSNIHENW